MRAWIERYREIYERYEPIFNAYQSARESDEFFASFAAGTRRRGHRRGSTRGW